MFRSTGQDIPTNRIEPLRLSDREVQRYSILRATDAARRGDYFEAGFEKEVSDELYSREGKQRPSPHHFMVPAQVIAASRDLTVASATGGGYLTGQPVYTVIDALRPTMVAFKAGAQSLTGLRANGSAAVQGGTSTVTWLPTEATQATETSTYALGSLAVTAKTAAAYVEQSRNLRLMAPEFGEALIRRDLRVTLSTAADAVVFNGAGGAEPLGILNTANIGTFTGASVAYAGLLEAQTDVLGVSALNEGSELAAVCRPAVASVLAARQGFSTLMPLWSGPLNRGTLVGMPAFSTMNFPATTLLVGDFSQVLVAEFGSGSVEIEVNPFANFQAGITGFRAMLTIDVAVARSSGFSVATSVS